MVSVLQSEPATKPLFEAINTVDAALNFRIPLDCLCLFYLHFGANLGGLENLSSTSQKQFALVCMFDLVFCRCTACIQHWA